MIGTNPQVLTDLRDLVDCIYSYPYHTHVENIAMNLKQLTTIEGALAKMSRSSWKEFFWFVGGQCENKIRLKLEERFFFVETAEFLVPPAIKKPLKSINFVCDLI